MPFMRDCDFNKLPAPVTNENSWRGYIVFLFVSFAIVKMMKWLENVKLSVATEKVNV